MEYSKLITSCNLKMPLIYENKGNINIGTYIDHNIAVYINKF